MIRYPTAPPLDELIEIEASDDDALRIAHADALLRAAAADDWLRLIARFGVRSSDP